MFTSGVKVRSVNFSDSSADPTFRKSGYDSLNFDFVLLKKAIQCVIVVLGIILFYGFVQTVS